MDKDELVPVESTEWYKNAKADMTPAKALKIIRTNARISQTCLASLLGMRLQNYNALEKGRIPITLKTAKKLATALGTSYTTFYKGNIPLTQNSPLSIVVSKPATATEPPVLFSVIGTDIPEALVSFLKTLYPGHVFMRDKHGNLIPLEGLYDHSQHRPRNNILLKERVKAGLTQGQLTKKGGTETDNR